MSAAKRVLVATALVAIVVAGAGLRADAAPVTGVNVTNVTTTSASINVHQSCALICEDTNVSFEVGAVPGEALPDGCPIPAGGGTVIPGQQYSQGNAWWTASYTEPQCNGSYQVSVTAWTNTGQATGTGTFTKADAPPPVSGLSAKANHGTVTLTWDTPADAGPDLTSITVTRAPAAGGAESDIADLAPDSKATSDVPASGRYVYRVTTHRYGTDVVTTVSTDAIDVSPSGTDTAGSSDPPTTGGSTASSAGTGGDTVSASTSPSGKAPVSGAPVQAGGAPSAGSRRPTPAPATTPQTTLPDEGYSTDLPYESEPGEIAASRPTVRNAERTPGAGLAVPFGVASVLGVWAMHILYVTRQARLTESALLPVEVE